MASKYWYISIDKSKQDSNSLTSWSDTVYLMSTEFLTKKQIHKLIDSTYVTTQGYKLTSKIREAFEYSEKLFENYAIERPHTVQVYEGKKLIQSVFISGRYYHLLDEAPKENDLVITKYGQVRTFRENEISAKCFPMVYYSDKTKCKKALTFYKR